MKTGGYLIAVVGILLLIGSSDHVQTLLKVNASPATDTILLITSLVLVLIGIVMVIKTPSGKVSEVPIYEGKHLVGYRRVKK
ncbi:hypothetical protein HYZ97_04755 [Candidatus Pacearchaeota archaeon]|nr:hypothetical protein [Candidatus Pacearchaeota archaeon]